MSSESDSAMRENIEFTLDLADHILRSAGNDPLDAFMKAVGTLHLGHSHRHPRRSKRGNSEYDDAYAEDVFWRHWMRYAALARL